MRLSRDLFIFLLFLVLLIGLAVVSAIQRSQDAPQDARQIFPRSTHSAQDNGALALLMWLDSIGYRTHRIENEEFFVGDGTDALFIFNPITVFDDSQVNNIVQWVERGNTLIVAEEFSIGNERLLRRLQVRLNSLGTRVTGATLEQPVQGGLHGAKVNLDTGHALALDRNDYVTYLSAENVPLLVSFPQGKGRVWFSSAPQLFDNGNLTEDANAALVMAMLSSVPRGGQVAFDEYHLDFMRSSAAEARSIQQLLFNTPWGWAILYSLVIVFAYLFVNGKRFGRVIPLPKDVERRSPAEYVTSMANLYRRAGKRGLVAHHYHRQLKRLLGKPYRINADLSDEEFVEELERYRDHLDREALLKTLRMLDQKNTDERSLVRLADQAVQLTTRR